jgi:hypothetical protein
MLWSPWPKFDLSLSQVSVVRKHAWDDDGTSHSPLIGFAFDGFGVYGPYEANRELAKDSKTNPLSDFNLHSDEARGPHYHVTPGQFPHIIGGYWGVMETRNRPRRLFGLME